MSGTYCIGLYTPNGHRRLEVPDTGGDPWDDIIEYDRRHGTNIYDLYNEATVEFDSRVARGLPPYDPSDEEYTLTGEAIADIAWVFYPSTYWLFDTCAVTETSWGFVVFMQGEDGGIVRQDVASEEMEADRRALDEGYAPDDGWEDGIGNAVCPSNGEPVMSAAEVVYELRRDPLDPPYKRSASRPKASKSRKSGTSTKKSTKTTTRSGSRKPAPKSSKNSRTKAGAKAPAKKTTRTAPRRR